MRRPSGPLLPPKPRTPIVHGTEWVGGRRTSPFWVTEGEPLRPELTLWLELPSGLLVRCTVDDPRAARPAFADTLRETMLHPRVGAARQPERVRIDDPALAAEVRASFGDELPVVTAPTPELDGVIAEMGAATPPGDDDGYLDGGRLSPGLLGDLFEAAALLWTVAPWKYADDDHVLRIDIPQLDLHGACLSVMGSGGQSFGFVLFPSFAAYEAFGPSTTDSSVIDLGTDLRSLTFERGAELSALRRREIAQHGWRVADPRGYPVVQACDRHGGLCPLGERDLRLFIACTRAITSFFVRHAGLLRRPRHPPVSESYGDAHEISTRVTAPYAAYDQFEPEAAPPHRARAGRNDPCQCGSGKKYKKCHLALDESATPGPSLDTGAPPKMDPEVLLIVSIWEWGLQHHPEVAAAASVFDDPQGSMQLLVPWAVFHAEVGGKPLVTRFLAREGRSLPTPVRLYLEAEQRAWLSVWEVRAVAPGVLRLQDLLSGEERTVRELRGSKLLVNRDAILGRVVTHGGVAVLSGSHPRALPPLAAAEVVRRARGRLRRKSAIPVERLRDDAFTRYLINRWEDEVAALDVMHDVPPVVHTSDGDPIVMTRDVFVIARGKRAAVEAGLARTEGALPPTGDVGLPQFSFVNPDRPPLRRGQAQIIIGIARIEAGHLIVETDSTTRGDALRRRIEATCRRWITFRDREQTDLRTALATAPEPAIEEADLPPELLAAMREMKAAHYASWVDEPIPALGGRTPLQASRTAAGRAQVELLLRDLENHESRLPPNQQADVGSLRARLGLGH